MEGKYVILEVELKRLDVRAFCFAAAKFVPSG